MLCQERTRESILPFAAILDRKSGWEKDDSTMRCIHAISRARSIGRLVWFGTASALILVTVFSVSCRSQRRRALADLHSREPRTRADAVLTLAELDGPDSLSKIGPLIKDPSAGVRLAVVRALAHMKSDAAMPILFTALRDRDPQIRLAAVDALGRMGSPAARDQLVPMLMDRDPVTRRAVAAALRRLGLDRAAQVGALARVRLQAILSAARSRQAAIRAQAAEKLGLCGLPEALPALKRLLGDHVALVADEALVALAAMGTKPALRLLHGALASGRFQVDDRLLDHLSRLSPSGLALVADAIPLQKVGLLLVGLEERCADHCPLACKTLCAWIAAPDWAGARSAWLLARKQPCPCAAKALDSLKDREKKIFLRLSAHQALTSRDIEDLAAAYDEHLPRRVMGPFLAGLPARIRQLVRHKALAQVRAYVQDSVSWLSEEDWKRLQQDPQAESLGRPAPKPQDRKARKLARLLSEYHPRSWKHVALLPPVVPKASAQAALDILGWLPDAEADLLRYAATGPRALRPAALRALANRPRKVTPALVAAIRSALAGPVASRAAAAMALRSAGSQAVIMLSRLLERDPSQEVRNEAAQSLAAVRLPGCRRALRQALRSRPEPGVVRALVAAGDGAAAPLLLGVLKTNPESLEMRVLVIEALGRLGSRDVQGLVEALSEQLAHPEPQVRASAARALGALGGADALESLKVCIQDFSAMVRRDCREALAATKAADSSGRSRPSGA